MKHILLLVVICLSTLQVNSASTSRDSSIVPQIQNVSQTTSKSVNSQDNPDLKVKPIEKYIVISGNSEEKVAWYNILAPAAGIIGLIISIYSIRKSSRVSDRNNQLSNEVKKLEIKMRTSDLVVAKRLEVFPKLHILTDTLGAAIRYYKLHIEDEKNKEWNTFVLKREIKTFQQKLSVWDANYCIYGGRTLTDKIRHVRQEILEKKEDVWKGKKENISIKELDELYKGLTDIEGELKREMKIHFTESED